VAAGERKRKRGFGTLQCVALLALKLFLDFVFARFGVSRGEIGFADAALLRPLTPQIVRRRLKKVFAKAEPTAKTFPDKTNLNLANC
jgi:hypothetical protein